MVVPAMLKGAQVLVNSMMAFWEREDCFAYCTLNDGACAGAGAAEDAYAPCRARRARIHSQRHILCRIRPPRAPHVSCRISVALLPRRRVFPCVRRPFDRP